MVEEIPKDPCEILPSDLLVNEHPSKVSFTKRLMPLKESRIKAWMADTGASVDAINSTVISRAGLKKVQMLGVAQTYETAAGDVTVDSTISLHSNRIGKINAVLLEGSPAVVSVGKRCMEEGYGFYWPPFTPPHIIHPDGTTRVDCIVKQYVPYIIEKEGTV